MNRKKIFNGLALIISKWKLRKSFSIKSFDELFDFAQKYTGRGFHDRISLSQFKEEFKLLALTAKERNPKVIVEIGTKKGGSFFIWSRFLDPECLISIDLPGGIHGGGFPKEKIPFMKYFGKGKNQEIHIILGDSHANHSLEKLKHLLRGRKIDFLFIDGDHTYDGVKSDFEMYSPLVSSGGMIAFHDIVDTEYHRQYDCYVGKFWKEIRDNYDYVEFIQNPGQHKYGIGILYK